MRALIQRVSKASVAVDDKLVSEINQGLLILVCAMADDNDLNVERMAAKISKIRVFRDENGKMNKSILDIGGEATNPGSNEVQKKKEWQRPPTKNKNFFLEVPSRPHHTTRFPGWVGNSCQVPELHVK